MFCFPNVCHCVRCLCSTIVLPECCLEGFVVQWAHTKTVRPSDVRKALRMIMSHHLLILVFCISTHKKLIRSPILTACLAAHNLQDEIILVFFDFKQICLIILFLLSPELKRIVQLDLDLKFRSNIRDLFQEFNYFPSEAVIGIAREMQPVYRYLPQLYVQSFDWVHCSQIYVPYLNLVHSYQKV